MMIIFGLIRILAVFLFLYLTWRRLRTDYNEEDLLSYSWLYLVVFLVSGRIIYGLMHWGVWNESIWDWLAVFTKSGFDYMGAYLGGLVFSYWYIKSKEWKIWNFAEDMMAVFLTFFLILMIGETAYAGFNLEMLLWAMMVGLTVVITNLVAPKYRSYTWYPSGKKGFVFFFANLVFGLGGLLVSWWLGNAMWIKAMMVVWGLISFGGLVMLGDMVSSLKIYKR